MPRKKWRKWDPKYLSWRHVFQDVKSNLSHDEFRKQNIHNQGEKLMMFPAKAEMISGKIVFLLACECYLKHSYFN